MSPVDYRRLYCETCKRHRRGERHLFSIPLGIMLSVCTCGIFFPVFLLTWIKPPNYSCPTCGERLHVDED